MTSKPRVADDFDFIRERINELKGHSIEEEDIHWFRVPDGNHYFKPVSEHAKRIFHRYHGSVKYVGFYSFGAWTFEQLNQALHRENRIQVFLTGKEIAVPNS